MSAAPNTAPTTTDPIAAATRLGAVRLAVGDLPAQVDFYTRVIGLHELDNNGEVARLGVDPHRPLVELEYAPEATARPRGTSGLYHLALLVPTRRHLAEAVVRMENERWGLTGASDHLVSEAIYTNDPEGNGIEIYHDRPRAEWPRADEQIEMATLPMDGRGVLSTLDGDHSTIAKMASGTILGHAHLNVDDLSRARAFWSGTLGFEVATDRYPGALFVAAGGYHHHIGLNNWQSDRPADPAARGLRWVEVVVPDEAELARVAARVEAVGAGALEADGRELWATDPAGNRALLRTATA